MPAQLAGIAMKRQTLITIIVAIAGILRYALITALIFLYSIPPIATDIAIKR